MIERLNSELVKAFKTPESEARLATFGMDVVAGTPEQFGQRIVRDQAHYGALVRQIGLKVD